MRQATYLAKHICRLIGCPYLATLAGLCDFNTIGCCKEVTRGTECTCIDSDDWWSNKDAVSAHSWSVAAQINDAWVCCRVVKVPSDAVVKIEKGDALESSRWFTGRS